MTFLHRMLTWVLPMVATSHGWAEEKLDFGRDVRPILSSKCFACHGPDGEDRKADLRLDTEEGALADLGGYSAVLRGKPGQSELVHRITTDDESDLMPPVKHKDPLSAEEIEILSRWVKEGAPYAGHWAFEPITRPEVPKIKAETFNPIDAFIGARLEEEGLAFSEPAEPETLVRRLWLDLTGLPPQNRDVQAFVADPAGQYDAGVSGLLKSPAFAERMALEWLDVARFADTNGYSIDDHRDMWAWRDWVIDAFAKNMPYDEFIRQQIAGDLMENATPHQQMATGFLRNAMNTHEGGTIAEEYRVARIADQIDTVSTAFLGLTVKCAQCHDHKYDPISQRDYYRLFAYFNTTSEGGKGAKNGNTKPFIEVEPVLHDEAEFKEAVEKRIAALEELKKNPGEMLSTSKDAELKDPPEESEPSFPAPTGKDAEGLHWIWAKEGEPQETAWFRKTFDLEAVPERAQLFVSCDNEAVIFVNGKRLGENPDWRKPSVFDLQPHLQKGTNLIAVVGKDWEKGKMAALFAVAAFSDGTYFGTDASWLVRSKPIKDWHKLGDSKGFEPARIIAKHGAAPWGDTFQLASAGKIKPKNAEHGKLIKALDGEIGVLRKSLETGKTTVMVMDSGALNRETPILDRGAYDQPGEIVTAGIPEQFGELPVTDQPSDRMALANWLVDPAHPLTARVTVNRYWQMLFGTGLVKTAEDFGSQGDWPSHPELLDWLAADFIESGWDVRALLKTMLMSRTYQQKSEVSEQLRERDPANRLLARASRYRLSAESVRDSALMIGGLLDREVGGPSVYPPQPNGLWKEVSHFGYPGFFSAQHFFPDRDEPAFRRSMYTFWKRTSPPPVMMAFDAPNRETCQVRRSLTNTPMQALVLMNEPQFVAAAHGLGARMAQVDGDLENKIERGFRLATARPPSTQEMDLLRRAYDRQVAYFKEDPARSKGYLGPNATPEAAALSSVASLLLNLDETITRE